MSVFTKRHYERIASILARHGANDEMILAFATMLNDDNPRFSRNVFVLRAMGNREITVRKSRELGLEPSDDDDPLSTAYNAGL